MNPHLLFDAAWVRLAVVGLDIIAVMAFVRLWTLLSRWWHGLPACRIPAVVRISAAGRRR